MFTGIVQGRARVLQVQDREGLRSMRLQMPGGAVEGLVRGASVAISGVCLTATHLAGPEVVFDVIGETLARTTLGELREGSLVNVERAARFGDEIGGHLLSGHVVGVAEVVERKEDGANLTLVLRPPEEARPYLFPKGFVALDGISLTLGEVGPGGATFAVHLIPETRSVTTIDAHAPGGRLNLEVDAMTQAVVDTVERVLQTR